MVCPLYITSQVPTPSATSFLPTFSLMVSFILPQATMASKPNQQFPCLFYIRRRHHDRLRFCLHCTLRSRFPPPLLSPEYSWPLITPPVISLPFL
ncbi:hypothetical protein Hanom_Chr10g00910801 [Helianthus anomalus]